MGIKGLAKLLSDEAPDVSTMDSIDIEYQIMLYTITVYMRYLFSRALPLSFALLPLIAYAFL
jgi:hypothetical protein